MIKEVYGDLIEMALNHEFDVIVHGCNCFCNMGSGIAKQIKKEFPDAYTADCRTKKGADKLGLITVAHQRGVTIVNAYTQYYYGRGKVQVNYTAIREALLDVKLQFSGQRIGLPLIGCGLAGGDWNIVKGIIEQVFANEDVTIVRYKE